VELAARAADELVRTGSTIVRRYHGEIRATIDQSGFRGQQLALSLVFGEHGAESSWTRLGRGLIVAHLEDIEHYLAWEIVRLAG
jgi:hypothetical protein